MGYLFPFHILGKAHIAEVASAVAPAALHPRGWNIEVHVKNSKEWSPWRTVNVKGFPMRGVSALRVDPMSC